MRKKIRHTGVLFPKTEKNFAFKIFVFLVFVYRTDFFHTQFGSVKSIFFMVFRLVKGTRVL